MGNCSTCPSKSSCNASKSEENSCGKISIKHGQIKNVIGVISGKGGVGKSTVLDGRLLILEWTNLWENVISWF